MLCNMFRTLAVFLGPNKIICRRLGTCCVSRDVEKVSAKPEELLLSSLLFLYCFTSS